MSNLAPLLERNRAFARTDARQGLGLKPRFGAVVLTCLDPRVDPVGFLGLRLADAPVLRNAGGRVTPAVIEDLAFIGYMGERMAAEGPIFEVAVIHHTQCGTGALADPGFRREFAERTSFSEEALAAEAVADPAATVEVDVERLLSAPQLPNRVSVSGHVYSIETGLVETVVAPRFKSGAATR